jgi:hypothetical protein
MNFELKDLLYIIGIVVSAIVAFYVSKHGIKEYVRDKIDSLKDEINELKIKHQELKAKDDLQQQVIDQIGKQVDVLIPKLVDAVKSKKQENGE